MWLWTSQPVAMDLTAARPEGEATHLGCLLFLLVSNVKPVECFVPVADCLLVAEIGRHVSNTLRP